MRYPREISSPEAIQAAAERLREKDEKREREHRAWLRLCGSLAPIGRLSDR